MTQASRETIEIKDLSKGLNTYDPETAVPPGYYVDAQNMLLTSKAPITVGGLTRLTATGAPDGRALMWFEPYTEIDGSFYFICFLDEGDNNDGDGPGVWKYAPGTDTWTPLWIQVGNSAADTFGNWTAEIGTSFNNNKVTPPVVGVPYRGRLIFTPNATTTTNELTIHTHLPSGQFPEFPLKWDGVSMLPLGAFGSTPEIKAGISTDQSQQVATFEATETTWTGGTSVATAGNRKEGAGSRSLTGAASMNLVYATARDFLTGLLGAPDLTTTDLCVFWFKRTAGSGTFTVTVRFGNDADTAYFEEAYSIADVTNDVWYGVSAPRSAFATGAGAPVWSSIEQVTITQTGAGNTVLYDAMYWYYNLMVANAGHRPVLDVYQEQIAIGGPVSSGNAIVYSDVGSPDYFAADNIARFSGGRSALESRDLITALWSYFDELIVGKPNSAWTFSGTGLNVSVSALPLTIGIGGTRAIVETPWSLHYYFDNNIFGARLTSRGLVSTNVSSFLTDIDNTKLDAIASIRSDSSHTLRWSFPTDGAASNDLALIYDYQLDAWASVYTPQVRHYTKWINTDTSQRELLCCIFDTSV